MLFWYWAVRTSQISRHHHRVLRSTCASAYSISVSRSTVMSLASDVVLTNMKQVTCMRRCNAESALPKRTRSGNPTSSCLEPVGLWLRHWPLRLKLSQPSKCVRKSSMPPNNGLGSAHGNVNSISSKPAVSSMWRRKRKMRQTAFRWSMHCYCRGHSCANHSTHTRRHRPWWCGK